MAVNASTDWGLNAFPEHTRTLHLAESHLLEQVVALRNLAEQGVPVATGHVHAISRRMFQALDELNAAIRTVEDATSKAASEN